jgi:hypothetical protein
MGGFNYQNNKNNPRIYKNSDELSLCSVFVKEFKIALRPVLKHLRAGSLHQRLMQLFLRIKALDRVSEKGSLNVGEGLKTLKGKLLLRTFVFTPKAGIRQQFGNPQIYEEDFMVVWEDFDPSSARFPKAATHVELHYLVVAYDTTRQAFSTYSAAPVRRSTIDGRERLVLQPQEPIVKKPGVHYMLVLGMRFLELLGTEEYELFGTDAVGIEVLEVFSGA